MKIVKDMSKKVLVISTRSYPPTSNNWDDASFRIQIEGKDLDEHVNVKLAQGEGIVAKRKEFLSQGDKSLKFVVYVAPCLRVGADDATKVNYIEQLVKEAKKDSNLDWEQVYLVAHDKDFNGSEDHVLLEKLPFSGSYPCLSNLVKQCHVYLFQHDDKGMIYKHIKRIPRTKEPLFGYEDCVTILSIITKEKEMIDYFCKINEDSKSYLEF